MTLVVVHQRMRRMMCMPESVSTMPLNCCGSNAKDASSKDLCISLFKQTPKVITKEHKIIENIASFFSYEMGKIIGSSFITFLSQASLSLKVNWFKILKNYWTSDLSSQSGHATIEGILLRSFIILIDICYNSYWHFWNYYWSLLIILIEICYNTYWHLL